MRPANLMRRTAFRLALAMALFVVAALLLASGIGYGVMHAQLTTRQDARVTEGYGALEQSMLAGDQKDLIEAVSARIAASPNHASIYLLKNQAGTSLAGNISDRAMPPGWSIMPADLLGIVTDYPYRVFTGHAGDYTLTVGLTDADLDDLREIVAASFWWSALIVLIAAIGVGAALARSVQHRLAAVDAAMHQVAQVNLAARLPISKRGDDLDQISASINDALARLADLVDAMRQVSTDIAHDLRAPLNRLRMRVVEAAGKHAQGQSVAADLDAALLETDQIDATFAALLRIAQIEAGARRAQFRRLDLGAILGNIVEIYADVAEDAGLTLAAFDAPSPPLLIDGDGELLTQMIANLIENAIRHCPRGTAIRATLKAEGDRIALSVSDTGPGIPEAEREAVLRRLYQREKSRSGPGNGLGLSLVKAIADLHRASLALSDAHPGLRVTLRFARA